MPWHDGARALIAALRTRRRLPAAEEPLVLPLAGGAAALVRGSARRPVVSVVTPGSIDPDRRGPVGWLERRQARRSTLLLVGDRPTALALAARWRVSLASIRLVDDPLQPSADVIRRHLRGLSGRGGSGEPWHAR